MSSGNITRIDYFTESMVIDLSMICYFGLKQVGKERVLKISFLNAIGTNETIVQHAQDKNGAVLTKAYLDLFTQLKNYQAEMPKTDLFNMQF